MAGRWRDPAAFRADASAAPAVRPSRRQAVALLVVLVLVAGATAVASFLIRPDRARSFDLLHGSMYLEDAVAPVAIDLASGRPTVQLLNAQDLVNSHNAAEVKIVPLSDGTLLLNGKTGTFNLVDTTGFVLKNKGGVPLPPRTGSHSIALASGSSAYIVQAGGTSGTGVYLVDAATVVRAAAGHTAVKPRAAISMPDAASAAPGSAATADGDLWLLVGRGDQRTIRRLTVPANSNPGVTLAATDRGHAPAVSAIGTATTAQGTVVGVASADRIQLFRDATTVKSVPFPRLDHVSQIVPVDNASGRVAFLILDGVTWKFVSVAADGTGLHAPTALKSIAPAAKLTPPAESNGVAYAMDKKSGQLFTIGENGNVGRIRGATGYPAGDPNVDQTAGWGDAYVASRDSRVVFNSPGHRKALVVFTDGSHRAPLEIAKSEGVGLDATAGVLEVAKADLNPPSPGKQPTKPGGSKPPPRPATPINNSINCHTAQQRPHTPVITSTIPASRSAQVNWTYPTTSTSDCIPSTWIIQVTQKGSSAPAPPTNYRVQASTSANLLGLFPSTSYDVTVTGYINGLSGDPSAAAQITTGAEGPAAPKNVLASTDKSGNWTITWASCGSARSGCVPTISWKVIPEICDGRGLSAPPDAFLVGADQSSVDQPPAMLHGGDALLGRGLRFQVEGIGEQGAIGRPSSFTACTYSWTPPAANAISLDAATPGSTQFGVGADAVATLHFAGNPIVASGGVGATYSYTLTGNGHTVSIGPTSQQSVRFVGAVTPGATYSVTARVNPPKHPEAAISVGPALVATSSTWPHLTLTDATVTADVADASQGTLTFSISGLSSHASADERFDFSQLTITCDNTAVQVVPPTGIDPAAGPVSAHVSNIDPSTYNTSCRLDAELVESAATRSTPPFYGGTPSGIASTSVQMPQEQAGGLNGPSFSAQFENSVNNNGQSVLDVNVNGLNGKFLFFTRDWSEVVSDGTTPNCGSDNANRSTSIAVDQACVQETGATTNGWTVTIRYTSVLDGDHKVVVVVDPSPTPPSYQAPCVVTESNFSANWTGTVGTPSISLAYDPKTDQLGGCSDWTYEVSSPSPSCTSPNSPLSGPPTSGPFSFNITCSGPPPATGWSIIARYTGTAGGHAITVLVSGVPPS